MNLRPPPDWYQDSTNPEQERWWNGHSWERDVRPAQGKPVLPSELRDAPSSAPSDPVSFNAALRRCPDCHGMVSVHARACPACGNPAFAAPAVAQDYPRGRSGYLTAAWVCVLFCSPLAVVFNLIDNSVCRARGLAPTFGPIVVAVLLFVVATLVLLVAP